MKPKENKDWRGRYQDVYRNESAEASDHVWMNIEDELFPKRSRRGVVFWLSGIAGLLLVSSLSYFFVRNDTNRHESQTISDNVLKNEQQPDFSSDKALKEEEAIDFEPINENFASNVSINDSQIDKHSPTNKLNYSSSHTMNPIKKDNEQIAIHDPAKKERIPQIALNRLPLNEVDLIESNKIATLMPLIDDSEVKDCEPKLALSYNFFVGKNMRLVSGGFDVDQSISKRRDAKRVPMNLMSHNINVHYRVSDKFSLSTGIGYARATSLSKWHNRPTYLASGQNKLHFQTSEGYCSVTDTSLLNLMNAGDTTNLRLRSQQTIEMLTIPLLASRSWKKNKWTTAFNFGLSTDLHFNSELKLNVEDNNEVREVDAEVDQKGMYLSLQGLLGVRAQYQITPKFELFAEQRLSVPLTSYIITDSYSAYSASMNLGIGLRYNFPCSQN